MSGPSEAFSSVLRIATTDDAPLPEPDRARPGAVTDASDAALGELRRRAVDPVVAALLRPGELRELSLHRGEAGEPGEVWVRLVAGGEVFVQLLSRPAWEDGQPVDVEGLAARLADHLQDWVCETGFGWGQQRIARYTCPE